MEWNDPERANIGMMDVMRHAKDDGCNASMRCNAACEGYERLLRRVLAVVAGGGGGRGGLVLNARALHAFSFKAMDALLKKTVDASPLKTRHALLLKVIDYFDTKGYRLL
jgi:hypothetical protein